jgi:glucokinase
MMMEMEKPVGEFLALGVDLGGTKVKTGLIDANGRILSVHKHPTNPEKGPEGIINDIITCIDGCLSKARKKAQALGIGVAGQVDINGVVRYAPNLKWRDVYLKKNLEERLNMPVLVINDVRAATWGEWIYGSGKGVTDLVVLFVGTGIGGGVISGGKVIEGCSNTGGELGHITIVEGGRKCHCPNSGCLEAYAGGWAVAERAQDLVRSDPKKGLYLTSLVGDVEKITAATVSRAHKDGDALARRLVQETGRYLAAGVVSVVNAFNPCLLVLGGGVIEGLPELVQVVDAIVKKKALESATENLKVVRAALGGDAGIIGAAAFAQKLIEEVL